MSLDVVVIEDSPDDVALMREAFGNLNRAVDLHVAVDGEQAVAFLERQGRHIRALCPALILLDLTLPTMDGHQILA